ncbi:hypothetical protein F5I97DRAFT_1827653 [Phlebopus sp. FC_14]|nr:hypothetical protein F5I97DRAFT_1827653 [Phlebopus sp. FC_14]
MNTASSLKRKNATESEDTDRVKRVKVNCGVARVPQKNTSGDAKGKGKGKGKGKAVEKGTVMATSRPPSAPSARVDEPSIQPEADANTMAEQAEAPRRPRIRKLAPPRPYPTVHPASSATGPRSSHTEGKNAFCITRRTPLAAYLRRCKVLLLEDGFKELKLSAMGAALPHLALLAVSLPAVLPWGEDEIGVEVFTGSVECVDEILAESGDEDSSEPQEEFRKRVKSSMHVIIRIGKGEPATSVSHLSEGHDAGAPKKKSRRKKKGGEKGRGDQQETIPEPLVLQEPEQDAMDDS